MTSITTLKMQFAGLSVRGALVTLAQRYRSANKNFIWGSQLYTVRSALEDLPDYLLNMKCAGFGVVRFFGGPPNRGGWYDGTLLTIMCDSALFELSTAGMAEIQKLGM